MSSADTDLLYQALHREEGAVDVACTGLSAGPARDLLAELLGWDPREPPADRILPWWQAADLLPRGDLELMLRYLFLAHLPPKHLRQHLHSWFPHLETRCRLSRRPLIRVLPYCIVRASDEASLSESQSQIPKRPGNYRNGIYLALAGRAGAILRDARRWTDDPAPHVAEVLRSTQIINLLVNGQYTPVRRQLAQEPLAYHSNRLLIGQLSTCAWIMERVLEDQPLGAVAVAQACAELGTGSTFQDDLRDFCRLPLADRAELADMLERLEPRDELLFTTLNLINFNAIRAALCLRRPDTARLLLQRHGARIGCADHLDHLFWMRLHLLEGDHAQASHHHRILMEEARFLGTKARVEFELRISRELPLGALAELHLPLPPAASPTPRPGKTSAPLHPAVATLIGGSRGMRRLREHILAYAGQNLPVLLLGETGTGKDLVARALHAASPRAMHPYQAINCAALNDSLLQAELFGHVAGGFTGAEGRRDGLIAAAGAGTLFLDEIGDTSPAFQTVLLRVLESDRYRPVGSDEERPVHCRIIAATNASLSSGKRDRYFRKDLLFRLQRLQVRLPPLRHRRDDLAALAAHFLDQGGSEAVELSADLLASLRRRDWPGNVRELRNEMDRLRTHHPLSRRYTLAMLQDCASVSGAAPLPRESRDRRCPAIGRGNPRMTRLAELEAHFQHYRRLTTRQTRTLLSVSESTATRYLQSLLTDGRIRRITPTPAPRTHYWEWAGS